MVKQFALAQTLRTLTTTPLHFRWLNDAAMQALESTVREAEQGHSGEIRVVIERALPLDVAWRQTVRQRAEDMFAHLRVWDTAARSGVLVYVNLAERQLELVADRGIAAVVAPSRWQSLCDHAAQDIGNNHALPALQTLLLAIGAEMRAHGTLADDPHGNELSNTITVR